MSGLNQQFTKLSTGNSVREFESHILRLGTIVSVDSCAYDRYATRVHKFKTKIHD